MNSLSLTSYPGEHTLKNFISYLSTLSCSRTSPLKPHMLMNNSSKSVLIYHLTSYLDEHLPLKFIAYFTEFSCYLSLFIAYLSISYLDKLIRYLALFISWQCQPLILVLFEKRSPLQYILELIFDNRPAGQTYTKDKLLASLETKN